MHCTNCMAYVVSNELRCHDELEDILVCVKEGSGKQEVFISETVAT